MFGRDRIKIGNKNHLVLIEDISKKLNIPKEEVAEVLMELGAFIAILAIKDPNTGRVMQGKFMTMQHMKNWSKIAMVVNMGYQTKKANE